MTVSVWLAFSWLALCAASAGAFLIGRAFAKHELEDAYHRILHLEGNLQRADIDRRDLQKQAQELRAALHHKSILRDAITEPARVRAA